VKRVIAYITALNIKRINIFLVVNYVLQKTNFGWYESCLNCLHFRRLK